MRKISYSYLLGLCLLFGCSNKTAEHATQVIEPSISGDYGVALPFPSSDARQKHKITARSLQDTMYIGTGLLELSKQHFSPKEYIFQEGQIIDYDLLDASDYTTGFLGRNSDTNPIGMNPAKESEFDSGNGLLKAPLILQDIYEIDFVKASEVKGISLAIVLNPKHDKIEITSEKLYEFGVQCSKRIVDYIRDSKKVAQDLPIFVTLYKNAASDDALPGSFFAQGIYTEQDASFTLMDEQWVMFKSSKASEIDASTSQQFQSVSDAIHNFLVDDVQVIGMGKYRDAALVDLKLSVHMYAKTGTEAVAVVQYLKSLITSHFTTYDYRLRVEIMVGNEQIALMERAKDSSDIQLIMFI
ncbi:MAG: CamS family sex pheromone protein [Erysipelotrichaceae bacterium]|nr:CamS family sex pheromone protein [Erysipelotrichaceae bacterium]